MEVYVKKTPRIPQQPQFSQTGWPGDVAPCCACTAGTSAVAALAPSVLGRVRRSWTVGLQMTIRVTIIHKFMVWSIILILRALVLTGSVQSAMA